MSRTRTRVGVVAVAALLAATTACTGGGSSPTDGDSSTPVRGGTLNLLGTSDVDYMDPNISYYSVGYLNLRMWSRTLFTYPAEPGRTTTAVPDLATRIPTFANGGISGGGTTYTITMRRDAMWNTHPARPVVAGDVVRGLKRTCNPIQPFGGTPDFATLIQGYQSFCRGFLKVGRSAQDLAAYMDSHSISGVSATDDHTLVYRLTQPASYFVDMLAMPAFAPAPKEFEKYLPASRELARHLVSDGPYQVASWNPTKEITYTRNPVWKASSDPIRTAYVDRIDVDLTTTQESIQQQLETNSPQADFTFAQGPPTSRLPQLIASKDPNLSVGDTDFNTPIVVFNTVSPNDGGALRDRQVRRAFEHAINRDHLIQVLGGTSLNTPLTHVLPAGIAGSEKTDPYDYDPVRARQLLAAAGHPDGLNVKLLYRSSSQSDTRIYQTLKQDLSKAGIDLTGVPSPDADFYTKYLDNPDPARRGVWDLSLLGWYPDWYQNSALSFFKPLLSGRPSFPPNGDNYGFYNSATTNRLIEQASAARTEDEAAPLWAKADRQVMADAACFPIATPREARYHGSQVHHAVYMSPYESFDPTNVWLQPGQQGG